VPEPTPATFLWPSLLFKGKDKSLP
jgi:hypothetical protein